MTCPYMLSEYLMGCKKWTCEKIILQGYHLVLQKSENLKDHPIDYITGVIIVIDNNYNFHRYLDNESVYCIVFAFLDVFSSHLNMIREVRLLSFRICLNRSTMM